MGDAVVVPPLSELAYVALDPIWLGENPNGWQFDTIDLPFQFMDLEEGIAEQSEVNYANIDVVGRAESYRMYLGTGNKVIPLTFKFHAQGLSTSGQGTVLADILKKEVREPALWLDALKYPYEGDDYLSHAPPTCILQIGQLFAGLVIATQVGIQWLPPFEPSTLLPYAAEVQCEFTVVRRDIGDFPVNNRWGA